MKRSGTGYRGFSLRELAVVLVIAAILALVGLGGFEGGAVLEGLATGWARFPFLQAGSIGVSLVMIAVAALMTLAFAGGIHALGALMLGREPSKVSAEPEAPTAPVAGADAQPVRPPLRWKWRWSVAAALALLLTFVVAIVATGLTTSIRLALQPSPDRGSTTVSGDRPNGSSSRGTTSSAPSG